MTTIITISIFIVLSFTLAFVLLKCYKERKELRLELKKYDKIDSIEDEVAIKANELSLLNKEIKELNAKFILAKDTYSNLTDDINIYRSDLKFIEIGIYQPIFDLDTSESYKQKILDVIEKQKELVNNGEACICNTEWSIGNSRKQGEVMTKRYISLLLRAFNGECNSLISKVKWNNVNTFENRINKSFKSINKLGKSNNTFITEDYLSLKIDELHLNYEIQNKKNEEKEERRAINAAQREEAKAQKELEKAAKQAELEEKRFQEALEKAKNELGYVKGEELIKLNKQIELLEENLKNSLDAKERAISRAQETKSGHVYIISNIGSFGENIYKIGMTRRLDPLDRIKELGNASVPFKFDLHALIFTKNAPELESELQKQFDDKRINKINHRKEYFNVTLEEIEKVVNEKYGKEVNFLKVAEAKEYRETKYLIENELKELDSTEANSKYPDSLF